LAKILVRGSLSSPMVVTAYQSFIGGACERPRGYAAEKRDELTPPHHSITSSASASSFGGISRPRALAVLRLMTNSNFVHCMTGKSAGLVPLRMRPV
jgi:hypothetical protein